VRFFFFHRFGVLEIDRGGKFAPSGHLVLMFVGFLDPWSFDQMFDDKVSLSSRIKNLLAHVF